MKSINKLLHITKRLGSQVGKKSAQSRLGCKTKVERSELMRKIRVIPQEIEVLRKAFREESLNA